MALGETMLTSLALRAFGLAVALCTAAAPVTVRAQTFTSPANLSRTIVYDHTGRDHFADVAMDREGGLIAVWSFDDQTSIFFKDDDVLFARSKDGGLTWSSPNVLNTNAHIDTDVDRYPRIATTGSGTWIAVWESTPDIYGPERYIVYARSADGGTSWSPPQRLGSGMPGYAPRLAADRLGRCVVVFESRNPHESYTQTYYLRSTNGGLSWSSPALLDPTKVANADGNGGPEIATDGTGTWLAAWGSSGGKVAYARSVDGGLTWSAKVHAQPTFANSWIALAADRGTWIAAWLARGTDDDIYFMRSVDGGASWSAVAPLNTNAANDVGYDGRPRIAANGAGTWLAVWSSGDSLGGTIGTDGDILYARSTDDGASWTAPAPFNTDAGGDAGWDSEPRILTDGFGRWVALWLSGGRFGPDTDISWTRSLDADDLLLDAGSTFGLWERQNDTTWKQIHAASPKAMVAGDLDLRARDDLVVDFGAQGVWVHMNDANWTKVHASSPEGMLTAALSGAEDSLLADFGTHGVWALNLLGGSSWKKLDARNPKAMAGGDLNGDGAADLIIDNGPSAGIKVCHQESICFGTTCTYSFPCQPLHSASAEAIVAGDLDGNAGDEVVIDFGPVHGIWVWSSASWMKLHGTSPEAMVTGDMDGNGKDELIVDFGPAHGVWVWRNGASWVKLHGTSPEAMRTADMDGSFKDEVVIDFGAAHGTWVYKNDAKWVQLHPASPEDMTAGDLDP